jgi:lysophospholipase-2
MGNKDSKEKEKNKMPDPVVVSASAKHTASLIFLHGLGDTGHGWATSIAAIRPPHVKVICPSAAKMPVTLNSGFESPSWFDLMSLDPSGAEDEAGIKKAAALINGFIEDEIKSGIPAERIMIGGFSQGGALALHVALTTTRQLGGVVALSCWLPLHKQFVGKPPLGIPCFQAHGDCDPIVPYRWGQMSASMLKQLMSNHSFKTYKGMMHSSNESELQDMKEFVATSIP